MNFGFLVLFCFGLVSFVSSFLFVRFLRHLRYSLFSYTSLFRSINNKIVYFIFFISLLLKLVVMQVCAYQPEWSKEFYNPNPIADGKDFLLPVQIGRAHVWTLVTQWTRMPSSAWKKKTPLEYKALYFRRTGCIAIRSNMDGTDSRSTR